MVLGDMSGRMETNMKVSSFKVPDKAKALSPKLQAKPIKAVSSTI